VATLRFLDILRDTYRPALPPLTPEISLDSLPPFQIMLNAAFSHFLVTADNLENFLLVEVKQFIPNCKVLTRSSIRLTRRTTRIIYYHLDHITTFITLSRG
jgi:hypothetical protein